MMMESCHLGNVSVKAGLVISSGFDCRYSLSLPYAACGYFIGSMDGCNDRVLMID